MPAKAGSESMPIYAPRRRRQTASPQAGDRMERQSLTIKGVRGVLFDLDGTLIESAADLQSAVNKVLISHARQPIELTQVVSMIGHGARTLVELAFAASGRPLRDDELTAAYDEMLAIYSQHLTDMTTLYPGAAECVAQLSRAGLPLAVVTNKPRAATTGILDHFKLTASMAAIIGGDSGLPRKPAPDMLLWAIREMRLEPDEVVMVGDSIADVESARAAGIRVVVVRGGYSRLPVDELGADAVLASMADLPALIGC